MKGKITIAIDPDCEKSGFALCDGKSMEARSLPFPVLIDRVAQEWIDNGGEAEVVLEAGWLHSSCWHLAPGTPPRQAAVIGNAVGRNHETGRKIAEMLRHRGVRVREVKPLRKFWNGKDRKITAEELNRQLRARNMPPLGRTSQDARDAALLCLAYL